MNNWKETEMQTLRDYLGGGIFKEADENGIYVYEDKDEGLKIQIRPTGDYNFELTFNDGETTEGALEVVGDMIIATFQFYYLNNDPEMDTLWGILYGKRENIALSPSRWMHKAE